MHRDDLISQVRVRARLHGRNEARRVIRAVLQAFQPYVPEETYRRIVAQLPAELAIEPVPATGDRSLTGAVAHLLYVNEPNAAFLTRVVFAQLNAYCHGVTPASAVASLPASSLPAEVRSLVSARTDDPAQRFRRLFPAIGPSAAVLSLRPTAAPVPAAEPVEATITAVRPATAPQKRAGARRP